MRIRCPHCQEAVESQPDATQETQQCPACGGQLDLPDETLTHQAEESHRLRIRCPQCRNPVESEPDAPLESQHCPACGSQLDLLGETFTKHVDQSRRTLGHFELLELLGSGSFGEVWMARDTQLDRVVAVKIPRAETMTAASAEAFIREARAAAQLRHPHIVSVHEVGREGKTLYIVSDFIRGVTLANYLAQHRPTPREAAALCATVADALHHAHEAGVVHRDLKPSNIMLDALQRPHLMDFGLAKRDVGEATLTVAGAILGTLAYMPPEQARGEAHQADRRSDVYSLGVVLYEALTGERPFRGKPEMLVWQIQHDDPPKLRSLDRQVPADLETICLKCLEKEPPRRYQTAAEVADELRRWQAGEPIRARPIGRPERIWRWCQRKPALAGLSTSVAVLIALVIVGGAVSYWRISTEHKVSQANLHRSLIDQAKALLATTDAGRRWQAAEALLQAAQIERTPEIRDQYLRCLDAAGFRTVGEIELPTAFSVDSAAFAAPRGTLLIAGVDGRVVEYDAQNGKLLRELTSAAMFGGKAAAPEFRFAYSAQAGQVAVASQEFTSVWTWATSLECQGRLQDQHGQDVTTRCLEFSQAGNWLATAVERGLNESEILVYDSKNLALLAAWKVHYTTSDLQFCAKDRLLAASVKNGVRKATASFVKLWRTDQWSEAASLDSDVHSYVDPRPCHLSASVDGRFLAAIGDAGRVRVWLLDGEATGATAVVSELLSLDAHPGPVHCAQISPDGCWLLTCGADDRSLKLWALPLGTLVAQETLPWPCSDIRWSSGGPRALLISAMPSDPRLIELVFPVAQAYPLAILAEADRRAPLDRTALLNGLEFDGQERWLACGSLAAIDLVELRKKVHWLPISKYYRPPIATFAPRGDELYIGRAWESANTKHETLWERVGLPRSALVESTRDDSDRQFRAMVVCQDGQPLAAGLDREAQRLVVWKPASQEQVLEISPEFRISIPGQRAIADILADHLRFSRDGSRLALVDTRLSRAEGPSEQHLLRVFALASPRGPAELPRIPLEHDSPCVALSADGRRIAVGQRNKCVVFDIDAGHELARFEGSLAEVKDVALDATGRLLASIGRKGRDAYLWDITAPARPPAKFEIEGAGPLVRVALSPGARWLAVADLHANVTLFDLERCRDQLRAAGFDLTSPSEPQGGP